MKEFSGTVKVNVKKGMKAIINPECFEGEIHKGKVFVVDSMPRDLCGSEVAALNKLDGSRFSSAYDLSMLQIVDAN